MQNSCIFEIIQGKFLQIQTPTLASTQAMRAPHHHGVGALPCRTKASISVQSPLHSHKGWTGLPLPPSATQASPRGATSDCSRPQDFPSDRSCTATGSPLAGTSAISLLFLSPIFRLPVSSPLQGRGTAWACSSLPGCCQPGLYT